MDQLDDEFVEKVNQNIGVAHKVSRIYFNNTEERNDVVQEMMYQLWRSYKSFNGGSKFSTWMYSVCLNTALTYRRKHQRDKMESLDSQHYQIEAEPSPRKDEASALLFDAIRTLTSVNRAIILLYLENLSYEEIANVTGLTKANVSVRLVRIKKELESALKNTIKSIEDVTY